MNGFVAFVNEPGRSEEGQDLLEYTMLVALIAIVAAGAVTTLGNTINTALWQVIAAANL